MSYQKKQVLKDNLEGLKTAYQILEEKRAASHEEKGILLKFKGWGGLKELTLAFGEYLFLEFRVSKN